MDARARASRTSLGRGAPRRVRRRRPRGNVDDGTCVRDRCSRATRSRANIDRAMFANVARWVLRWVFARRRVGCCVGRCVPPDCLRIRPTDRTLDENNRECRFSPATRRRPPLVDARGTRRESRDAIKNIIIARARRSSFVDVIARARSPAPARVVDRARFRSSSRRRLRRLSCCARSVVVVVQPISRDS